ncbi:hypothetical protein ACFYM0_15210 [Streptomyces sp. NPDC006487]
MNPGSHPYGGRPVPGGARLSALINAAAIRALLRYAARPRGTRGARL